MNSNSTHRLAVVVCLLSPLVLLGAVYLLRRVQHPAEWAIDAGFHSWDDTRSFSGPNWQWVEDAAYG